MCKPSEGQANAAIARGDVHLVTSEFVLTSAGRFLVAEFQIPHLVLSTSARNGGQQEALRFLVNHQSCEGKDHRERQAYITEIGLEAYHDSVCRELNLDPALVSLMGTAANMNNASITQRTDGELCVTAVVTGGVQGNATCAGDPAAWREANGKWEKVIEYAGTINTILLINQPVTRGALARAVVSMTEAKTATLQRLAIGSLYSRDVATGTGTDQYCIAAPLTGKPCLTSASTHVKLGELIAAATREATLEALRWQNGLEASYTRSIFHALGRYGLREEVFLEMCRAELSERSLELLRKNGNAVYFEPLVAASAFALAAVLDRIRYGTLPLAPGAEALRQQAAGMASNLAARSDLWNKFYAEIGAVNPQEPLQGVVRALALGWSAKWQ